MPCHLEPQQLSPAVTQNQERKQEIKGQRRHNAHIDGGNQGASLADHDEILVTLTIDPGYHPNANPASADYLMPTVVTVQSAPDAKITYPAGQVFKSKFSPEGISLYEGSVAIRAELPRGRLASAESCALTCSLHSANLSPSGDSHYIRNSMIAVLRNLDKDLHLEPRASLSVAVLLSHRGGGGWTDR
jgi:hypothetical protein